MRDELDHLEATMDDVELERYLALIENERASRPAEAALADEVKNLRTTREEDLRYQRRLEAELERLRDGIRQVANVLDNEIGWFDATEYGYASLVDFEDFAKQEQAVERLWALLDEAER